MDNNLAKDIKKKKKKTIYKYIRGHGKAKENVLSLMEKVSY